MLYLETGRLDKAEPFIRKQPTQAFLGRYYFLASRYNISRDCYDKLLEDAVKKRNADRLFTAYTGLGAAYEAEKNLEKAAEFFQKAIDLTEDLRSGLGREEREMFFDVKMLGYYRTAPYEGLARVLMKMNKPAEAFKASEYTKARRFAEAMAARASVAGRDVPADVLKKDGELTDQLAALKKRREDAYEKGERALVEKELDPRIQALDEKRKAHIKDVRAKYPLFAAVRYPEPMDLADASLRPEEWVLAYDVTDEGVLIYLINGTKIVLGLFKPISRKDLDELVRKFREPLEITPGKDNVVDKLKSFDFSSGRKLADLLVGDVLKALPEKTPVMVVPDDSLGVLPFEMLVMNDGGRVVADQAVPVTEGATFFVERNPTFYYQSVTALALARTYQTGKAAGTKVLVMNDPVFSPDDPRIKKQEQEKEKKLLDKLDSLMSLDPSQLGFLRLPMTGELGEFIKALDPSATTMLSGLQASKQSLLKEPLDQYKSMVFATHGYFGKDLPGIKEPVLVLTLVDQPQGEDGFLRMTEVMGLKLNADIVALTACQTGLGRRISGEGTMGMGRAFQYAGARSVLMSLWSVDERASVRLVETFFDTLKKGGEKIRAISRAREVLREEGYEHPFFWASFILVGETGL
ncbi:MAG: CHAT domain-containing tetratricopeptide repeat protein, partial [Pseudomonadota bacterium]